MFAGTPGVLVTRDFYPIEFVRENSNMRALIYRLPSFFFFQLLQVLVKTAPEPESSLLD
jgi:hypothetical protein